MDILDPKNNQFDNNQLLPTAIESTPCPLIALYFANVRKGPIKVNPRDLIYPTANCIYL